VPLFICRRDVKIFILLNSRSC